MQLGRASRFSSLSFRFDGLEANGDSLTIAKLLALGVGHVEDVAWLADAVGLGETDLHFAPRKKAVSRSRNERRGGWAPATISLKA